MKTFFRVEIENIFFLFFFFLKYLTRMSVTDGVCVGDKRQSKKKKKTIGYSALIFFFRITNEWYANYEISFVLRCAFLDYFAPEKRSAHSREACSFYRSTLLRMCRSTVKAQYTPSVTNIDKTLAYCRFCQSITDMAAVTEMTNGLVTVAQRFRSERLLCSCDCACTRVMRTASIS